jgi:hypothetical protein
MPHDFILPRITISISTLSKYVREKKNKKTIICIGCYLHAVQIPPCHVGGGRAHLYRVEAPPSTNVRHLYRISRPIQMLDHICIRWFVPVQYPVQMRVLNRYKCPFFQ